MSEEEKKAAGTAEPEAETQAGQQAAQPVPEKESKAEGEAQPQPEAAAPEKAEKKEKKKPFGRDHEQQVLETKLAASEKALAGTKDQLLRTAAEYENYRKRTAREADQKFNDGISFAVTQIIPILDTLEMAAAAPCEDEAFKKGVMMTLDKAAKALEALKITEIEAEGKPFDPNRMNAVSQMPAPEGVESGTVVTVYQKGYELGGKVIRHATVVVAE